MTEAPLDRPNLANKVRFVTATTLFDGHDASINIFRRILQASGAEVIHLGHNRTGLDIVDTAIEEDAHAIAVRHSPTTPAGPRCRERAGPCVLARSGTGRLISSRKDYILKNDTLIQ